MSSKIKVLLIMAFCSAFMACGQKGADKYTSVTPAEFVSEIKADPSAYILDVRTPHEYDEGHVAGAHNLDWLNQTAFKEGAKSLPKGSTIYVYCRSGGRSAAASNYLSNLGYKVVNLNGGFSSLKM